MVPNGRAGLECPAHPLRWQDMLNGHKPDCCRPDRTASGRVGPAARAGGRESGPADRHHRTLAARRGTSSSGRFLRGLCAALYTDEEYLLGLEPGDLILAQPLVEPQGELGLLSPDEEALLKHDRRLPIPVRAATALLMGTAAGVVEGQAEARIRHRARGAGEARGGGETQDAATPLRSTLFNLRPRRPLLVVRGLTFPFVSLAMAERPSQPFGRVGRHPGSRHDVFGFQASSCPQTQS